MFSWVQVVGCLRSSLGAPRPKSVGLQGIAFLKLLQAVCLCRWRSVEDTVMQHGVFGLVLDLLFAFPNNNILHKQVETILLSAFSSVRGSVP